MDADYRDAPGGREGGSTGLLLFEKLM